MWCLLSETKEARGSPWIHTLLIMLFTLCRDLNHVEHVVGRYMPLKPAFPEPFDGIAQLTLQVS